MRSTRRVSCCGGNGAAAASCQTVPFGSGSDGLPFGRRGTFLRRVRGIRLFVAVGILRRRLDVAAASAAEQAVAALAEQHGRAPGAFPRFLAARRARDLQAGHAVERLLAERDVVGSKSARSTT